MDVEVYYGGQRGGSMPYTALPAFRLFCKQNGFQLKWDPKNKRVDLDSGLKGKVCVLYAGALTGEQQAFEKEIVEKVQRFVSEYGMEIVLGQKNDNAANQSDVAIRVSVKEQRALEKPKIVMFQPDDRKDLTRSLQSELKQTGMACLIKASKVSKSGAAIVHVQLQFPQFTEIYKRKTYGEKIAFYLASGILNYFQEDLRIQPLAYLPPNLLKVFFDSVLLGQSLKMELGSTNDLGVLHEIPVEAPEHEAQLTELGYMDGDESDEAERLEEQGEQKELEELGEEHLELAIHGRQPVVVDEIQESTISRVDSLVEMETELVVLQERAETPAATESVAAAEPAVDVVPAADVESSVASETIAVPGPAVDSEPVATEQPVEIKAAVATQPLHAVPVEERVEAEVFFDYTLIHSDSPDRPFLLIGTLQVKNTGTEALYNPIVCLRVTPPDSIKMGGQILPPKLVETLAIQDSSGMKGWRYLDDDWFSQAQERGEYWIAPIQPVLIAPKATEAFQNFQISFLKQPSGQTVMVEGIVLCNNQEVHFSSNNRIAVSF